MTHDEIKERVISLCSEIFQNSELDTDILEYVDFTDDLGMDSITFISFVVEIEATFGITVLDDLLLMDYFRNVDAVVRVVEEQLTDKNENK